MASKVKAVFIDIDGTLLTRRDGKKVLLPSAREALEQLQKKGIRTYIATGRHVTELDSLPLAGIPFDGYILLNGQLCLDGQFRPLWSRTLSGQDKELLLELFNEKEWPVVLVNEKEMYLNCMNDYVRKVQEEMTAPLPDVKPYSGEELFMAAIFSPYGTQYFKERFPTLRIVRWHDYAADVLPADRGKAVGMKAIMDRLGIGQEEVMAFGDEENDMDMLKLAGIGVAMGNAIDLVKEAADYVTDDVDGDGLANALRHFGVI